MKNVLSLLLLLASSAALADDAAVLKCRALPEAAGRLACYDAMPVGSEPAKEKVDDSPASVESTIVGNFDGWGPNARIKLANGQVWRVIDDSSAVLAPLGNPKVRIVRNLFGTQFLSVEGTNSSAKVRRVE